MSRLADSTGDGSTGFTISAVKWWVILKIVHLKVILLIQRALTPVRDFILKIQQHVLFENCISSGHQAPREAADSIVVIQKVFITIPVNHLDAQ